MSRVNQFIGDLVSDLLDKTHVKDHRAATWEECSEVHMNIGWVSLLASGKKVDAIKELRGLKGYDLKMSKDIVDFTQANFVALSERHPYLKHLLPTFLKNHGANGVRNPIFPPPYPNKHMPNQSANTQTIVFPNGVELHVTPNPDGSFQVKQVLRKETHSHANDLKHLMHLVYAASTLLR